jgi:FRG domain
LADDIGALMVLRYYGVRTRPLDWSSSPWVAAYFAVEEADGDDGEIWGFDEPSYEREGAQQWRKWPETTVGGSGDRERFEAKLTAFRLEEPPDWFICAFYRLGFPRMKAQQSAFSMTARFGKDHAEAIATLLKSSERQRYVGPNALKPRLREFLRDRHGIWRGSLFPDSAGAAETADVVFKRAARRQPAT